MTLCTRCGVSLSEPHSISLPTDGWYSFTGHFKDGSIILERQSLSLHEWSDIDESLCANCGVVVHGDLDQEGELPDLLPAGSEKLLERAYKLAQDWVDNALPPDDKEQVYIEACSLIDDLKEAGYGS
jgi:hypothetical protein